MKILIKEGGKTVLYLSLPTRLLLNRLTSRLIVRGLNQYSAKRLEEDSDPGEDSIPAIPDFLMRKENLDLLFHQFLLASKKFRGLVLLDVQEANGSSVLIRL